jgi:hypothetical protein
MTEERAVVFVEYFCQVARLAQLYQGVEGALQKTENKAR